MVETDNTIGRNSGMSHDRVAHAIWSLLDRRGPGKTICPSEIARRLSSASDHSPAWRELMPAVRACARELARSGQLIITRGGTVVDPETAAGPIRLGLPPRGHG